MTVPANPGGDGSARRVREAPGPTNRLASVLSSAEAHLRAGRTVKARALCEDVLERAQTDADRHSEVVGRILMAECALAGREPDEAGTHLSAAERLLADIHSGTAELGRLRITRLAWRVVTDPEGARAEAQRLWSWADEAGDAPARVAAARTLARLGPIAERDHWLQRALDHAERNGLLDGLADTWLQLAADRETAGDLDGALDAYRSGLDAALTRRQRALAGWGIGAVLVRQGDWVAAQRALGAVLTETCEQPDCDDLLCFALSELARVHEAQGEPAKARTLLERALRIARDEDLATLWPAKVADLVGFADRLDARNPRQRG